MKRHEGDATEPPRLRPLLPRSRFTLSHTRGMLAVALAAGRDVGVDARGRGLALPRDQLVCELRGGAPRIGFDPARGDDPAWWRFERWRQGPTHAPAVAPKVPPSQAPAVELVYFGPSETLLRRAGAA